MSEIWKPLPGFEACGEVSNAGRVRTLAGRNRKTFVSYNGYERVGLLGGKATVSVHRLVALAFCKGYDPEKQVNHKDGNKLNNTSANLEWVFPQENTRHAIDNGLRAPNYPHRILPQDAMPSIIARVQAGEMQKDLASEYGIKPSSLSCRIKKYKEAA